jgi:hypothetical protein
VRAVKLVSKKLASIENFTSICVGEWFYPVLEYFFFDFWKEVTRGSTNSTNAKIEQVRSMINMMIELYASFSRYYQTSST